VKRAVSEKRRLGTFASELNGNERATNAWAEAFRTGSDSSVDVFVDQQLAVVDLSCEQRRSTKHVTGLNTGFHVLSPAFVDGYRMAPASALYFRL